MISLTAPTYVSPAATSSTVAPHEFATRSVRTDMGGVPNALRSEWIKLSSIRSNRAILAVTTLLGGLTSWAVATFVTDEVLVVSDVFIFSTVLTAVLAAVAGILLFTSEVQHGTLAAALTGQPARWVLALAKTATAAVIGLVLGAAGMAASWLGAVMAGLDMGESSTMAATTMWALVFTSSAALLGLGTGMVIRHGAGAISGLLVWWLVVENLLTFVLPAKISRFLPFFAGNGLLGIESDTLTPESIAVALSRPENALVLGGYTVVALIIGTVLLYRRDTN